MFQFLKKFNLQHIKQQLKNPAFWARFAGFAIPIAFLAYVMYLNYLPFGYNKTFTLNIGSANDTKVSEFYLEPSPDLSERKVAEDGSTYRELNGMAKLIFKPRAVLKNAKVTVEAKDDGVLLIPPFIDFNPASLVWDYGWDFTKELPKDLINKGAFYFDGNTYFSGNASMEMVDSKDLFEDGPFTIYAEWTPIDDQGSFQQIAGHYNWELLQYGDRIRFMVGRMNDKEGPFYNIEYIIKKPLEFFSQKHMALAIYYPSDTNGYIELFVDGEFVDRVYFGTDKIWNDYNGNKNLSFGKSGHGAANYFKGAVNRFYIVGKNIFDKKSVINFVVNDKKEVAIPIITSATTTIANFKLHVD